MLPPDTWLFLRSNINYFGVSLVPIFWILNQFAVLLKQITAYQWQFRLQINSSRASSALIVLFLRFGWKSQFRARRTSPWNTQNPLLVFVQYGTNSDEGREWEREKRSYTKIIFRTKIEKKMHSSKKKVINFYSHPFNQVLSFQRKDALKIVERRTAHIELALICYKSSLVRMYCRSPYLSLPQG